MAIKRLQLLVEWSRQTAGGIGSDGPRLSVDEPDNSRSREPPQRGCARAQLFPTGPGALIQAGAGGPDPTDALGDGGG